MWQDWVMSIGSWAFALALIPTIIGSTKPPLFTSLLTAIVLSSYVVCLATLGLTVSAVSTALSSAAWWVIAVQTYCKKEV